MPAAEQAVEFAVVSLQSPVHGGVKIALSGPMTIGRDLSSDVVLSDPSLSGTHLRVEPRDGEIVVTAVDGRFRLEGGCVVEPGEARALRSSGSVQAGDLLIRIDMAQKPEALPRRGRRAWPWLMAAVLLGGGAIASTAYSAGGDPMSDLASTSVPPAASAAAEPGVSEARRAILAELRNRGLTTVTVDTLPEGSNRASGSIDHSELAAWHDARRWADAAFGSVLLIDDVVVAAKGPPLAVQSAWIGERPYVMDGAGEKLFVGAVLPDGWAIERIEAGRVHLDRQGQKLVVRF